MNNLKNLWSDNRSKSMIKLCLWFLFFIIVFIFCYTSPKKEISTKKETDIKDEFASYEEMKKDLFNKKYNYTYKITYLKENNIILYNGIFEDNLTSGYLESKEKTVKYSCDTEKCYQMFTDHQEEFDMINPIKGNLAKIITLLNTLTPLEKTDNEHKSFEYVFENDPIYKNIVVNTSLTNITKITINENDLIAEIDFLY